MKRDLRSVRAIQNSMLKTVGDCFSASELDALRVVVRLTVEFRSKLETNEKIDNYVAASVFAGIESFTSLVHAYGVLEGSEMCSLLRWKAVSPAALKREFRTLYRRFLAQKSFEPRCRLLLDLFKLQIAFAAIAYDCDNDPDLK